MDSSTQQQNPSRHPRSQDTDEVFLRALWDGHGSDLLNYAYRLTSDMKKSEDIVQEALVRAWKHADKLSSDERLVRPWLFTVVAHLAIDSHRAKLVRPKELGGIQFDPLADSFDLEQTIQGWEIFKALSSLSDSHREIIIETYYKGRSAIEAAESLCIPIGTVKSRMYHALRSLRLILEEQGLVP